MPEEPDFGTELVLTVVRRVIEARPQPEEAHPEHSLSGGTDGNGTGHQADLTDRSAGADAEELDVMTGHLLAEVRAGMDVDVAELRFSAVKVDYLMVSGPEGRLLADDQWCTGRDRQTTSLYAANLMACGPKS